MDVFEILTVASLVGVTICVVLATWGLFLSLTGQRRVNQAVNDAERIGNTIIMESRSAIRAEPHRFLEALPRKDMARTRDLLNVLLKEPEELDGQEIEDLLAGEEELKNGEWVTWGAVRRKDV